MPLALLVPFLVLQGFTVHVDRALDHASRERGEFHAAGGFQPYKKGLFKWRDAALGVPIGLAMAHSKFVQPAVCYRPPDCGCIGCARDPLAVIVLLLLRQ